MGSFAPANAASSIFTCAAVAPSVAASLAATNGQCSKTLTTALSCASATFGNGVVDPGEQCDPVPADLNNCAATCQIRSKLCDDGFLELGEACDGVLSAWHASRRRLL